jgi:hypothetical protein
MVATLFGNDRESLRNLSVAASLDYLNTQVGILEQGAEQDLT